MAAIIPIELLLKGGLGFFCNLPSWAKYTIVPLVAPIFPGMIGLLNHLVYWVFIFVPIWVTDSKLNKDKNGNKTFSVAALNALWIYYIVYALLLVLVLFITCQVRGTKALDQAFKLGLSSIRKHI